MNLFNISFTQHGSLHKEMKTKEMVKPGCFYTRVVSGKPWENVIGQNGMS